ncbi:epoxide hydrolase family protein [Actinokineospora sp. 24-640]
MQPFTIAVPEATLTDLGERLARTRLPGALLGAGWRHGTSQDYLAGLLAHWRDSYDWRAHEAALNAMPQYRATVNGLDLHFVHARGKGPNPVPLLFNHGWGGSFWEVHKIIGPLTDPAAHGGDPADSFDVIAPSLPGFGFSPDPARPGVNGAVIADAFQALMRTLGYPRFGVQGGDWGSRIASTLAFRHPSSVVGLHLNLALMTPYLGPESPPLTKAERKYIAEVERWQQSEGAYLAVHSTKPQSLAYGLNDSPAGLAGWLLDKFHAFSDCDGDLSRAFTMDELITNLMIYWTTGTIGSSLRLYAEGAAESTDFGPTDRITPPTALARFPAEIFQPPREWLDRLYNLTRLTDMPRGGHFAAVEQPDLLVADLRAFFRQFR